MIAACAGCSHPIPLPPPHPGPLPPSCCSSTRGTRRGCRTSPGTRTRTTSGSSPASRRTTSSRSARAPRPRPPSCIRLCVGDHRGESPGNDDVGKYQPFSVVLLWGKLSFELFKKKKGGNTVRREGRRLPSANLRGSHRAGPQSRGRGLRRDLPSPPHSDSLAIPFAPHRILLTRQRALRPCCPSSVRAMGKGETISCRLI